jgi:hypothetical protein
MCRIADHRWLTGHNLHVMGTNSQYQTNPPPYDGNRVNIICGSPINGHLQVEIERERER